MIDDHDRCEWLNVSSGTSSPGLSQTNALFLVVARLLWHLTCEQFWERFCFSDFSQDADVWDLPFPRMTADRRRKTKICRGIVVI